MNSLTFKCGLVSFKCVTTETAITKNPACPLKISLLNRWKMCCTMQQKYLWGTLSEPVIFLFTMCNESSALQFNYFPWLHKFCFFSKSRMKILQNFHPRFCILHFLHFRLCMNSWYNNQSQNTELETPMKYFRKLKWWKRRYIFGLLLEGLSALPLLVPWKKLLTPNCIRIRMPL